MHRLAALVLPLLLTACDYDGEPQHPGDPAVSRLGVRTVSGTTPQPGDTLTFYALFPNSTSARYRTRWNLDVRGKRVLPDCVRALCVRWVVPPGKGTYNHAVQVSGDNGLSGIPFTTVVP